MPIKQGYAVGLVALFSLASGSVHAQDNGPSHTFFGTSGLLEMPTAESAERSDISATFIVILGLADIKHPSRIS